MENLSSENFASSTTSLVLKLIVYTIYLRMISNKYKIPKHLLFTIFGPVSQVINVDIYSKLPLQQTPRD